MYFLSVFCFVFLVVSFSFPIVFKCLLITGSAGKEMTLEVTVLTITNILHNWQKKY